VNWFAPSSRPSLKLSAAARATKLDPESQHQVAEKALAGDAKAARAIIARALADRRRSGPPPLRQMLRSVKSTNTVLWKELEEAKADFITLRDPLPADVATKAGELAALAAANDDAANKELAALALQYHWRLRDLFAECRQHPEPSLAMTSADESTSDEGSAS
jgi:hypothetical protein